MKDYDIVERFLLRDESALTESKKAYGDYCLRIAMNMLGNRQDAEECLNDVLLAAWNSIPPHRPSNLRTFLGKLARQIAIDRLRKNTAKKRGAGEAEASLSELEEITGDNDVESAILQQELSRAISAFLRSVREDDRNVFIRRYWFCDPVQAICERYGFGKSKVLMMLKRTRDRLAAYLRREGYIS